MSELNEFEYISNSLTNMVQLNFMRRLAGYFKVPVKLIRNSLDKDAIKDYGLLSFSRIEGLDSINEDFYLAPLNFKASDLISLKQFEKSKLNEAYVLMKSVAGREGAVFVVESELGMFVLVARNKVVIKNKGVGGYYINYPGIEDSLLLPIETYLQLEHPLPPCEIR